METTENKTPKNHDRDKHGRFVPGNTAGFQPGNNMNPNGRPPKELCLTSLLKEALEQIPEDEKAGKTWAQLLILALLSGGRKGNATLLKEAFDRVDGSVPAKFQGDPEKPLEIVVRYANRKKGGDDALQGLGEAEGSGQEVSSEGSTT